MNISISDTIQILGITFSFLFSSIALYFSYKSNHEKKFNIQVTYMSKPKEFLFDRKSDELPDFYWNEKYRLFPHICITNNSTHAVSITKFSINNSVSLTTVDLVGETYKTTISTNRKEEGGITKINAMQEKSFTYNLNDHAIIKPVVTLQPYEAVSGLLFFHYNDSLFGRSNILKIHTSRGTKEVSLNISKQYKSALDLGYSSRQPNEWMLEVLQDD